MLGIAADDIFVFCDAWRQSELIKQIGHDEHRRMAYAFKRAFRAIAVTSSTTAVAFLANATSDIRPIRAFGIYAAIIIPVNFFIVILTMPSIQILHDRYFKERCSSKKICCCKNKTKVEDIDTAKKKDCMSIFFESYFNPFIFKVRYVAVGLFFVLGIGAAIMASNIGPLTKEEEFLPKSDPLMKL